jgi:hypothetical protein
MYLAYAKWVVVKKKKEGKEPELFRLRVCVQERRRLHGSKDGRAPRIGDSRCANPSGVQPLQPL